MSLPLALISATNPELHKTLIPCENGTICTCPLTLRDGTVLQMVVLEESSEELREYINRHSPWCKDTAGVVTATESPTRCCIINITFYPKNGQTVIPVGVHLGSGILGKARHL